jgi:hypothetical protein
VVVTRGGHWIHGRRWGKRDGMCSRNVIYFLKEELHRDGGQKQTHTDSELRMKMCVKKVVDGCSID